MRDHITNSLTIVQVAMKYEVPYLKVQHSARRHSAFSSVEWIVVDNDSTNVLNVEESFSTLDAKILIGKSPRESLGKWGHWSHSLHHAESLDLGFEEVKTRYALILDPDFFLMDWGYLERILEIMNRRNLDFYGTPWFPRYSEKNLASIAPHFTVVNVESLREKEFRWLNGVNSFPSQENLNTPDAPKRSKVMKKLESGIEDKEDKERGVKKLLQGAIRVRFMYKNYGRGGDTGNQSFDNDFTKQYLIPCLTADQIADICGFKSFKFTRLLLRVVRPHRSFAPYPIALRAKSSPKSTPAKSGLAANLEAFVIDSEIKRVFGFHLRGVVFRDGKYLKAATEGMIRELVSHEMNIVRSLDWKLCVF